jgi:hypothetical protein
MKKLIKCGDLPSEATVESTASQNRKLSLRQNIAEHFVLSFEITHRDFATFWHIQNFIVNLDTMPLNMLHCCLSLILFLPLSLF